MIRRAILIFALVAPLGTILLWRTSIALAIGVLFVSHMLIAIPTLTANLQWLGPVVTRFRTSRREIWLTIDDGPDPADTSRILDVLERHGVQATFFVKGELVLRHPELARSIVERGHTLANHSTTHPSGSFWRLGPRAIAREIDDANAAIAAVTGANPPWFRAPIGMKNPFVHPILATRRMMLVGWSARGWDTVSRPASAAARILSDVAPGSIVLVHQGSGAWRGSAPAECIALVVPALVADGWTFVVPASDDLVI